MSMLKKELVDTISDNLALHKQDVNIAVDGRSTRRGQKGGVTRLRQFFNKESQSPSDQKSPDRSDDGYR